MQDQITSAELKAALDKGEKILLLDVREPREFDYTKIPGSTNIPLNQLPARLKEIDAGARCVTICHHGIRSARAQGFLVQNGVAKVQNLAGGLAAYMAVDSTIKHY